LRHSIASQFICRPFFRNFDWYLLLVICSVGAPAHRAFRLVFRQFVLLCKQLDLFAHELSRGTIATHA
jgi:hypothetical protein